MTEKATFAAGCFWGVEETFRTTPGVLSTQVGYCNGRTQKPTYEQVCGHGTGHAEAVELEFDPAKVGYDALLDIFWNNHNPTTLNRQGPDVGDQYRSGIFFHGEAQKKAAEASRDKMNAEKFKGKIVTVIEPAQTFWRAEEYHQQYLKKRGLDNCHI
jgi:peptide-methionine (S)-S-oxide reductase